MRVTSFSTAPISVKPKEPSDSAVLLKCQKGLGLKAGVATGCSILRIN